MLSVRSCVRLLIVALLGCAMAMGAEPPKELVDAEAKYANAVVKLLENARNDSDARRDLVQLNRSFVKHLRKLLPKLQARSAEQARMAEHRIVVMESKLDASQRMAVLDGRTASGGQGDGTKATVPGPKPEGELDSREAGQKVEVGENFEIRGKTKNIPKGHVVQVFGIPKWGGMFPKENQKEPNRRFSLMAKSTENWLGSVDFVLLSVPESLMQEIDAWMQLRRRWEDAGFPVDTKPLFRGVAASNIYMDQLITLGALKLAEMKVEYVR